MVCSIIVENIMTFKITRTFHKHLRTHAGCWGYKDEREVPVLEERTSIPSSVPVSRRFRAASSAWLPFVALVGDSVLWSSVLCSPD